MKLLKRRLVDNQSVKIDDKNQFEKILFDLDHNENIYNSIKLYDLYFNLSLDISYYTFIYLYDKIIDNFHKMKNEEINKMDIPFNNYIDLKFELKKYINIQFQT